LRRGTLLLMSGFVSEIVYLLAVRQLPWWRYGGRLWSWAELLGPGREAFGICLTMIGLLTTVYLWGWRLVRVVGAKRGIVWGFAGLFAATLFWLMPITSDLFLYLSRAHLFTDLGANPLLDVPLDFHAPLLRAYPAFYTSHPSLYGPSWVLMTAPGTLGSYDVAIGLSWLKGLAIAAYLGCAWLLERILRQLRPAVATDGLYLFAWNPLVLLMAIGDGHNDIVMMSLVLLAFWLLLHERWALAFGALATSVWIKYVSLIFVPLTAVYVWRQLGPERAHQRWTASASAALVFVLVSAVLFFPFSNLQVLYEIGERLLWPANWRDGTTALSAWGVGLGMLLFVLAYILLGWRLIRSRTSFQQLGNACFAASLFAFLLGAARSQPWHLIWLASLAGLSDRRWAWPVVVGLSAVMLVVQTWVEWGAPGARGSS
jgi:hypothetical protein